MVGIGQDVAVAVDGGLDEGVAQLGLDEFDVFVLDEKMKRRIMPFVVSES